MGLFFMHIKDLTLNLLALVLNLPHLSLAPFIL